MISTPFWHFCNYLPFEEDLALYFKRLEFSLPKNNLYQVWLNSAGWFWRIFFLNFHCIFTLLLVSPLGEGQSPSVEQTWVPFPKDDLRQVWLKFAQWFWRRFLNDPTPFLHFCDYIPLQEDVAHNLNKHESPSPKDNLYQVWLNLARWFWRRIFLKMFSVFLRFCYYLPFEMDNPLHLNKLETPPPRMICAKYG
jgi:hypothetical protein